MIEPADLAWAAGYLDGESCFHVSVRHQPSLRVASTQLPPLVRLAELFGGKIHPDRAASAKKKATWYWKVTDHTATQVARLCEPFMIEKREQAAMLGLFPVSRRGHKNWLNPAQRKLRTDIDAWLRHTKTRGYDALPT